MKGFRQFGGKMRSGHHFPSGAGFSGSTGRVQQVRSYTRKVHKADGGSVDSSVIKRTVPMTQFDAEHGGKEPLRPGFAIGGRAAPIAPGRAMSGVPNRALPPPKAAPGKVYIPKPPGGGSAMANGGAVPRGQSSPGSPGIGGAIKDLGNALLGTRNVARRMPPPGRAKGGKIGPIKKGALHKAMGIKQGQKIPLGKLEAEKKSSSPLMRKRANFAINARKWNHKADGGAVKKVFGSAPTDAERKSLGYANQARRMLGAAMTEKEKEAITLGRVKKCDGGRMYAKGGAVAQCRDVAKQEIHKHVNYPAPQGHKGLGKAMGFNRKPMIGK